MLQAAFPVLVRKRPRPGATTARGQHEVKFKGVTMYLVERRMGSSRRSFLTSLARSKGFCVEDDLSGDVTHVVAEGSPAQELWAWLRSHDLADLCNLQVLDISWFTESMGAGRPVTVETRHRIQVPAPPQSIPVPSVPPVPPVPGVSKYACQRRTTTLNHNKNFTDALEVLAESCDFRESKALCLAYRRAASVLRSLPSALRGMGDTEGLPCLGKHIKAVLEDILECGVSTKVEETLNDEKYQILKLFTSVFGVGPKTAERWFRRGLRTLEGILTDPDVHLNHMQKAGFQHYEDISQAVTLADARAAESVIKETVSRISPSTAVVLTGGFRRGKLCGHDVDFILFTPEVGKEEGLLRVVVDRLTGQGLLLFCDFQESTFDRMKLPSRHHDAMDHYPKCFLILKVRGLPAREGQQGGQRDWRAVRVDLVVPPADRFAYALLGWSGSTQFDRDLRRYARMERGMLLDNHGLYDKSKKTFLQANTEEEIFAHLGLEYLEPWQRNA